MAQFTNQAQLSYNNAVTNSNVAVGEIQEVLAATKTAVSDEYSFQDRVAYAISLINSGDTALNGITVRDDLGAYTNGATIVVPLTYVDGTVRFFVNGVLQATPTVTAGTDLVVSGLNIPANSSAIIVYEANANQFAPLDAGSTINNSVTVSGAGITPVTADAAIPVSDEPSLSIAKSISPVPVTENGTLTYTFVFENTGNTEADAASNASITDIFNPILSNVTATFNGTPWVAGTDYQYTEATGTFISTPGRITVPAATYTQDPTTGAFSVTPGRSTLVITGTV